MSTADRDDLAAILDKHTLIHFYCYCGAGPFFGDHGKEGDDPHRAHVAQMVLESDWLRQRDGDKWAEGHRAPRRMTMDITDGNPYRADRVDAEDTHTQPEAETEDRWCPTCQKYRPTIDDECTECGTDT